MTITQAQLRAAAIGAMRRGQSPAQATAFLCHSHLDRTLALGLQELLRQNGMDLYIDWQDSSMPDRPSAETASLLRRRIQACSWFIFLATSNSMTSRWCPWELGHADGIKQNERILLVPTHDGMRTHGSEYLNLYRRVELANNGEVAAFPPNSPSGSYVKHL